MIEIALKLSSDFKTKKEASPEVVPVVHNSPSVLEQNLTIDLVFFCLFFWLPKAASHAQKCGYWLFLLMSRCWLVSV